MSAIVDHLKAARAAPSWTAEHIALIAETKRRRGMSRAVARDLATIVGRTDEAVLKIFQRPPSKAPSSLTMPCLCCGTPFKSVDRRANRLPVVRSRRRSNLDPVGHLMRHLSFSTRGDPGTYFGSVRLAVIATLHTLGVTLTKEEATPVASALLEAMEAQKLVVLPHKPTRAMVEASMSALH